MFGIEMGLCSCLQWLGEAKTSSQVLLGAAFSFNTGVALLKRFREELNQRLITAIHTEVNAARNAGWLGHLELLEDVSSPEFKEAARRLMMERDRLDARPLPFVVWTTRIAKALMLICASVSLVCMAIPHTARWTVFLFFPYPLFVVVANIYEWRKMKTFRKLRDGVKNAFGNLPEKDKKLLTDGEFADSDVKKKLKATRKRAATKK